MRDPSDIVLAWDYIKRLDAIQASQHSWVHNVRKRVLKAWQRGKEEYMQWRQDVDAVVANMRSRGDVDGVGLLLGKLLERRGV